MIILYIILIFVSLINIYAIALLITKNKVNMAIGLATIQSFVWVFKLMGYI